MSDNEVIMNLQRDLFAVLNNSTMPLMVKSLVVENALLKLNSELKNEQITNLQANQEVNLHVDTLEMNTGSDKTDEVKQDNG
uniref:Uncharacterized protein n=1 Tax=virus sp. ctqEG8 TaxID=2827998 RepID=A0A8S5RFL0_9VIRU|nr:MAG TPA: hypothetical protein [virus sp. ctqEG8]